MNDEKCWHCGAMIRRRKTRNGKTILLHAVPDDQDGRWIVSMGIAYYLNETERDTALIRGQQLYVRHQERCPRPQKQYVRYVPGHGLR